MRGKLIVAIGLVAALLPGAASARPAASQFTVVVTATPTVGSPATVQAHTRIGAACVASVLYDSDTQSQGIGPPKSAGQTGIIYWQMPVAAGREGRVSVTCTWKGQRTAGLAYIAGNGSPAGLNLLLADMPAGLTLSSNVNSSNADAAKPLGESLSQVFGDGRITSNEVTFKTLTLLGFVAIDALIEEFTSESAVVAHWKAHPMSGLGPSYKPMSVGTVGTDRLGWQFVGQKNGITGYGDYVIFYRNRYLVSVTTASISIDP